MAVASTTMDFFKNQDTARRKSSILVGYYCLAVALIILAVYLTLAFLFLYIGTWEEGQNPVSKVWNTDLFLWVTGLTLLVVASGTVFKIAQMSAGGDVIARMLGGRPVDPGTVAPDERKVMNVVEEMSIASGVSIPRVFMLDGEEGINAFAAGFSPNTAIIVVTRGCAQYLTRDELQGVIAHEFSHILNGDMRLNLRLLGVLHGILIVGLIGYWTFRVSTQSSGRKKGGFLPLMLAGLGIWAIGYIGVFFGKLIKSAVSRQREYLADASAVQFTRNPDGIASALKKIAGYVGGTRIQNEHAEEASHFFFCDGLASPFWKVMATHPPIEERIRRIDPSFKPEEIQGWGREERAPTPPPIPAMAGFQGGGRMALKPEEVLSSVGAPQVQHMQYAAALLASYPARVIDSVRQAAKAKAVIYALLLDKAAGVRQAQVKYLAGNADAAAYTETLMLVPIVDEIPESRRLPLVDLATASLRGLPQGQYLAFKKNVDELVKADKEVDLFEYMIRMTMFQRLDAAFGLVNRPSVKYGSLDLLAGETGTLLSCLAYWGTDDMGQAQKAFAAGVGNLAAGRPVQMLTTDLCGLHAVDEVLKKTAQASPQVKKSILDACIRCVGADGSVTVEEAELIRAIAASMECPLPPFLPTSEN